MRWHHLGGASDPVPPNTKAHAVDRGRRIGIVLALLVYRMRLQGVARIPPTGPVIFAVNHSNTLDGPILFGALPRRVSFLVKAEMFHGLLGWLLKAVGQYGLNRDVPDRAPLMSALAQLKAGGSIGIFPEGSRGDGGVESVFNGAGWLAARSGASVVPIAMRGTRRPTGTSRRFRPRVEVLIGEAFAVLPGAGRTAVNAATAEIREKLKSLVEELDQAETSQ
ncbi:1-acyl-sn-glycerol-3-phosphate acyltransferase [Nakamurella antarctica]|uniref:1-acyl-sn-glycerol-3-phosphate acyltransferase n=1 Tax=Nakamurella antarctica TaxID=1902245 RepID=A0A3G8ZK60_9ACTN|nr:lysophospholipid acyltransferase family protein [Nakamurella antarctica]AZI57590.1 1-acyl-sn-glycerol-3-phosphate acyltransferase [Nakamurella antarctica]